MRLRKTKAAMSVDRPLTQAQAIIMVLRTVIVILSARGILQDVTYKSLLKSLKQKRLK